MGVFLIVVVWAWVSIYNVNQFINRIKNYLAKDYAGYQRVKDDKIFSTVEEAQYDFEDRPRSG